MNGTTHPESSEEPHRIKQFHAALIKAIPRFPNDRTTLRHMQQKPLGDLLIDYLNWRSRYVGIRPRKVIVEQAAAADPRWRTMFLQINAFLEKVKQGNDLTPHLSLKPHTQGYTPKSRVQGASAQDKWLDKDFQLNTKGYHHFHLGASFQKRGHVQRTDDLIFAYVERDTFTVIAIFSHDAFELGTPENQRLQHVHDEVIFRGHPPGAVILSNPIATSGHALHVVTYARHCLRTLRQVEGQLDSLEFSRKLYDDTNFDAPATSKFEWVFSHLDLAIYDIAKPALFVILKGWN